MLAFNCSLLCCNVGIFRRPSILS